MGFIQELISEIFSDNIPRKSKVKVIPFNSKNPKTVIPDNTPLYIKRGWMKKGNQYQGYYRTRYGSWRGLIERRGDKFIVIIVSPPKDRLKKHKRWVCFHHKKGNHWSIHLAINPKDGDISAIIYYVEKIINDSYRL